MPRGWGGELAGSRLTRTAVRLVLALHRFPDVLYICKVAGTSRREFRTDKIFGGNEIRFQVRSGIDDGFDAPFPGGVKIDARNVGKNIETFWVAAKAKETVAIREILRTNALERRAELGQRGICRLPFSMSALMNRSMSFVKRGWE